MSSPPSPRFVSHFRTSQQFRDRHFGGTASPGAGRASARRREVTFTLDSEPLVSPRASSRTSSRRFSSRSSSVDSGASNLQTPNAPTDLSAKSLSPAKRQGKRTYLSPEKSPPRAAGIRTNVNLNDSVKSLLVHNQARREVEARLSDERDRRHGAGAGVGLGSSISNAPLWRTEDPQYYDHERPSMKLATKELAAAGNRETAAVPSRSEGRQLPAWHGKRQTTSPSQTAVEGKRAASADDDVDDDIVVEEEIDTAPPSLQSQSQLYQREHRSAVSAPSTSRPAARHHVKSPPSNSSSGAIDVGSPYEVIDIAEEGMTPAGDRGRHASSPTHHLRRHSVGAPALRSSETKPNSIESRHRSKTPEKALQKPRKSSASPTRENSGPSSPKSAYRALLSGHRSALAEERKQFRSEFDGPSAEEVAERNRQQQLRREATAKASQESRQQAKERRKAVDVTEPQSNSRRLVVPDPTPSKPDAVDALFDSPPPRQVMVAQEASRRHDEDDEEVEVGDVDASVKATKKAFIPGAVPSWGELSLSSKRIRIEEEEKKIREQLAQLDREEKERKRQEISIEQRIAIDHETTERSLRRDRQPEPISRKATSPTRVPPSRPMKKAIHQHTTREARTQLDPEEEKRNAIVDALFTASDTNSDGFASLTEVTSALRSAQSPLHPKPSARLVRDAFTEVLAATSPVPKPKNVGMYKDEVDKNAFQLLLDRVLEEQPIAEAESKEETTRWKKAHPLKKPAIEAEEVRHTKLTPRRKAAQDVMMQRRPSPRRDGTSSAKTGPAPSSPSPRRRQSSMPSTIFPSSPTTRNSPTRNREMGQRVSSPDSNNHQSPPRTGVRSPPGHTAESGITSPPRRIPMCHAQMLESMKRNFKTLPKAVPHSHLEDMGRTGASQQHGWTTEHRHAHDARATSPSLQEVSRTMSRLEKLALPESPSAYGRYPSEKIGAAGEVAARARHEERVLHRVRPFLKDRADLKRLLSTFVRSDRNMTGTCTIAEIISTVAERLPASAPRLTVADVLSLLPADELPSGTEGLGSQVPYASVVSELLDC